jgi:hypothetical protein
MIMDILGAVGALAAYLGAWVLVGALALWATRGRP